MKYRAEIDGLRALAVLPVILFHAGFELFSGGFVGVDIFFVISGYLIATILIEDIEKNRFSLVNLSNGYAAQRYSTQQLMYFDTGKPSPLRSKCHFSQEIESLARTECQYFGEEPAEIAVLGNSHATELAYGLAKVLEKNKSSILHHTMSGCRHNFKVLGEKSTVCQRWHDIVIKKLTSNSSIKTVVLVLQAPLPGAHIDKYLNYKLQTLPSTIRGMSIENWNHTYRAANSIIEEISNDVIVVNPTDYFCESNECLVVKDGKALYFDDDHMSVNGAKIIAKGLVEILKIE